MKDIRISGEGLFNLCTAVINKAHQYYITGTSIEIDSLRQFIRGPLFKLYTMNINADPEAVIQSWDRDRSDYRAKRLRICN